MTGLDVAALRAHTPGCDERNHLNNAGAALPTERTLQTVIEHLRLEARIGGYEAQDARADALSAVRTSIAQMVSASPDEVALTTSDTAAWTKLFWGFALGGGFDQRRRVLVDRIIYNSHWFAILQARDRFGLDVHVVASAPDGSVDLGRLAELLAPPTALVCATHVPTQSGVVNPVAQLGQLAASADVAFFLDACQSVGQLPVDVGAIRCDALTATGRKWLRAPRGTGFLYVARHMSSRLDPPGIDSSSATWVASDRYELASDARRFEEFEASIAAQLGLGAAVDQLLGLGVDAVAARIAELAGGLRDRLSDVPGVVLHDGDGATAGIVTFTVPGSSADEFAAAASQRGINLSVSRAPFARMDLDARGLDSVVRASPHVYNTTDELDALVGLAAG